MSWYKNYSKWRVCRWSKIQDKTVYNGYFDTNQETKAAHASDTLARTLIANGEQHKGLDLNFPDNDAEYFGEVTTLDSF